MSYDYCSVYQRSVFVSQIGPHLPFWLRRFDFVTPCDVTWTIIHVEWSFCWPIASCLTFGACCVFWWGLSDGVLGLFWSWLFRLLCSFCQRTVVQAQLACAWKMRVSSEKAGILQAFSGLAQKHFRTICTDCRERVEGKSREGRMRNMDGQVLKWISSFRAEDIYVFLKQWWLKILIDFFHHLSFCFCPQVVVLCQLPVGVLIIVFPQFAEMPPSLSSWAAPKIEN